MDSQNLTFIDDKITPWTERVDGCRGLIASAASGITTKLFLSSESRSQAGVTWWIFLPSASPARLAFQNARFRLFR